MTVYPMIDRKTNEILLIYRNSSPGKKWLDAVVYAFHPHGSATYFHVTELSKEYLATLSVPGKDDVAAVDKAISYYSRVVQGKFPYRSIRRAALPLPGRETGKILRKSS